MHFIGQRVLHSAAVAPKRQIPCFITNRSRFAGSSRGFLSSPTPPAPSDELESSKSNGARSETTNGGDSEGLQGDGAPAETPVTLPPSIVTETWSSPSSYTVPTTPSEDTPAIGKASDVVGGSSKATNLHGDNLKDTFSGFVGRGRTTRSRGQDAMPAVNLPNWFMNDGVRLNLNKKDLSASVVQTSTLADLAAASRIIFPDATSPATAHSAAPLTESVDMAAVTPQEREEVQLFLEAWFNGAAWDALKISQARSFIRDGHTDAVQRRGSAVVAAASYLIAALSFYAPPTELPRSSLEGLGLGGIAIVQTDSRLDTNTSSMSLPINLDIVDPGAALSIPMRPFGRRCRNGIRQTLKMRSLLSIEREASEAITRGFSTGSDVVESLAIRELKSTIAAELQAVSPRKPAKDRKRPVTILTIMNYRGRSKAVSVIDDVANALSAHVVHLDANSLAEIVGSYMGQTVYWSRGKIAMLGYTTAEKNGRMAARYPSRGDDETDSSLMLSRIPVAFMKQSGLTARLSVKSHSSEMDDRWDDLKVNNVLEAMILAADVASAGSLSAASHRLLIHVHNFIELSSTPEGAQILSKISAIIDRLWQRGRKIVLIGSTSTDMNSSHSLLEKAEELQQEDHHFIPLRVTDDPALRKSEKQDVFNDNMGNIRRMISALTAEVVSPSDLEWSTLGSNDDGVMEEIMSILSANVFDVHWAYRFTTQILGHQRNWRDACLAQSFLRTLRAMKEQDRIWQELTGAQEPYYSPLTVGRGLDDDDSSPDIRVGGDGLKKAPAGEYNEYEKKLLSDLIDAKEIKTTFDSIICAAEIKDSLKALTSLALIRPEAFLYGVLAAERIPGCLLYGPPGTGKTLMAKAVAKESGANMLEVSAASINDMWVGNSEKNVQALFSLARKLAPVVIFLDEADALLGARQTRPGRGGHRETINQFLREWDGLTDMEAFIMVATNRPFDLDEAVLRRLPRRILVDLPLEEDRLAILKVMLRDEILGADSGSLEKLASETELFSGSDLKNLCVAAAMEAVREEVRAKEMHKGPEPFIFPERRVLLGRHFDRALQEIGASISEDMSSLQAIRRFDERYGDRRRKKRRQMGFEVVPSRFQSEDARVRQAVPFG